MNHLPEDQQVYDPQSNYRVRASFGNSSSSYTPDAYQNEYNGHMYQPNSQPYALKYPHGFWGASQSGTMPIPSERYRAPPVQAEIHPDQPYTLDVPPSQIPSTTFPAYHTNAPFPPPSQGQPMVLSAQDHLRRLRYTHQASEWHAEMPSRLIPAEANHSVGWTPRSAAHHQATVDKDETKSFEYSDTLAQRYETRVPPRKSIIRSVNDLLNTDCPASSHCTSNPIQIGTEQGVLPRYSTSNLTNVAQNDMKSGDPIESKDEVAAATVAVDSPVELRVEPNLKSEDTKDKSQAKKSSSLFISHEPKAVLSNNAAQTTVIPVPSRKRCRDDVPFGGVPRDKRQKEDPALKKQAAQLYTDDIHSTIPLKKSKFAVPEGINLQTAKAITRKATDEKIPKNTKANKKRGKLKENKRRFTSYSLIVHSGDESDGNMVNNSSSQPRKRKQPVLISHSDDEDFVNSESPSKKPDSSGREKTDDNEEDMSGTAKPRTSRKKVQTRMEGTRKSPRLGKQKKESVLEPAANIPKRPRVIQKNERKRKTTKSLDELSDSNQAQHGASDSDDDFVPTSDRGKLFAEQKAQWLKAQQTKEKHSVTPKKVAKRKAKKQEATGKRDVQKVCNSDGEKTDSRVDEQFSDSDSQNPSQRGSQPLEVKITSLSTKRRRRKTDFEEERKRLTESELTTIRLAFVSHYPPPPSNAQAQGRFEMRYGREMSQAMIQGLWEKELKHWSERWWKFYTGFNDLAREKKLAKPVDKNPTITKKEAEAWAQTFYEKHGDARISPVAQKPQESEPPSSDPLESSQKQIDKNFGKQYSSVEDSTTGHRKMEVESKFMKTDDDMAPDKNLAADHQAKTDSQVVSAGTKGNDTEIGNRTNV